MGRGVGGVERVEEGEGKMAAGRFAHDEDFARVNGLFLCEVDIGG